MRGQHDDGQLSQPTHSISLHLGHKAMWLMLEENGEQKLAHQRKQIFRKGIETRCPLSKAMCDDWLVRPRQHPGK